MCRALVRLAVLHHDGLDGVGDELAGVGTVLEERIDIAPGDDGQRVKVRGVQAAHRSDVDVVALAFDGIYRYHVLAQALGALELRKFEYQVVHLLSCAHDLGGHLERGGVDLLNVSEVDAVQDTLDAVDDDVDAVAQGGDILALDGGDEGGDQRVVDRMDDLVGSCSISCISATASSMVAGSK